MRAVKVMNNLDCFFPPLISVTLKGEWREILICTGTDWNGSEDKWIQEALIDIAI